MYCCRHRHTRDTTTRDPLDMSGLLTCFLVVAAAAAAATADVVGVRGSISQTVRRLNDAPCCRLWPRAIVADCFALAAAPG